MGVDLATYRARIGCFISRKNVSCDDNEKRVITRMKERLRVRNVAKALSTTNLKSTTITVSSSSHTYGRIEFDTLLRKSPQGWRLTVHLCPQSAAVGFNQSPKSPQCPHHSPSAVAMFILTLGVLVSYLLINQLLILSGNVELNPGPVGQHTEDSLLGKRRLSFNTKDDDPPYKLIKQGVSYDVCKGIRVFYYNKSAGSDHSGIVQSCHDHTDIWNSEVAKISQEHEKRTCLEAGIVVNCSVTSDNDISAVEVRWDCGAKRMYSNGQLENICILDMGPAGYRTPIVLCDICETHLTGFSFRCTHQACSADEIDVFDLCYKHYNEGCHLDGDYKDHKFQCIMQSTLTCERTRNILDHLRSETIPFILVGLFAGAQVTKIDDNSKRGKLRKVVHKDGISEMSKAGSVDVWHCTAEVEYEGEKELVYEDIGNKGKVSICTLKPGDGGPVYADHFPTIGSDKSYVIKELLNFDQSTKISFDSGGYCYISQDPSTLMFCNALVEKIDLEKVWSSCNELKLVDFMYNKLSTIPEQLLEHKNSIISMGLSLNHFRSISILLFEFINLVHLNMNQNQLTVIPPNIECFCNLKILLLEKNAIRVLPDEIGDLVNLEILGLSCNLLICLPQSVSKLRHLKRLELHHNHFKVFPAVLCSSQHLPALKILTLDNNRIQIVPDEAKDLISKKCNKCTIHSNPIQIKGVLLGPSDNSQLIGTIINNNIRSNQRGTLRVLVIGKSGSGKSSLVRALVDKDNYITPVDIEKVDHTVGINTYFYRFVTDGIVNELNLWDFAGEKCYAMMNQMFISPGSLVWLVYDMSKYIVDNEKCFADNIGTWFRAVISRISEPVVWIIGTHADKCSKIQAVKINIEKFLILALDNVNDKSKVDFIKRSKHVFAISNAHDLIGHSDLHDKIEKLPMQKEFSAAFEELKPNWSKAEEYLKKRPATINPQQLPIVGKDEAFQCLKKENLIDDEDDFNCFIDRLHAAGEILLFKGNIYLDIVFLIQLLREIFRSDLSDVLNKELGIHAENVISTGIITRSIISKLPVWKTIGVDKHLKLLLDFGLAFEFKSDTYQTDRLLFPWLLIDKGDKITLSNIKSILQLKSDNNIFLMHPMEFIPPSFFERFCCSVKVQIDTITRNQMSAYFNYHSVYALLVPKDKDPYKGCIVLIVSDERQNCSYSEMWSTLKTLTDTFDQLIKEWKGIGSLETYVLCPKCVQSLKNPYLFDYCNIPLTEGTICVTCNECKEKIPANMVFPPQGPASNDPAPNSASNDPAPNSSVNNRTGAHVLNPEDVDSLFKILKSANTKWKGIGRELGFAYEERNNIVPKGTSHDEDYFEELLSIWLKWAPPLKPFPCTENLIKALRETKELNLALTLESNDNFMGKKRYKLISEVR